MTVQINFITQQINELKIPVKLDVQADGFAFTAEFREVSPFINDLDRSIQLQLKLKQGSFVDNQPFYSIQMHPELSNKYSLHLIGYMYQIKFELSCFLRQIADINSPISITGDVAAWNELVLQIMGENSDWLPDWAAPQYA